MLACGLLLAASAPGFNLSGLAWVALIPALCWVSRQTRSSHVFWGGFWLGAAYHGLYCLWFFDLHPLNWLGFNTVGSRMVTLAGWSLLATEGGVLMGLLMLAYHRLPSGLWRVMGFPVLWVGGFGLLSLSPMTLPWALLEYSQAAIPAMRGLASLIGGGGLTGILIAHNTLWAETLHRTAMADSPPPLAWRRWAYGASLLGLVGIGLGPVLFPAHPPVSPLPIAIIQANLPIEAIRSTIRPVQAIEHGYFRPLQTTDWPAHTLVVFPEEGVVPGLVPAWQPARNPWMGRLIRMAQEKDVYIAVGLALQEEEHTYFNALALISPQPDQPVQYYRKRRLVPFGEFTPYGAGPSLSRLLSELGIGYSAPYQPGKQATALQAGPLRLGGLICFELIDTVPAVGGYAVQYARQTPPVDWLINVSNLGWFHQNPVLEAQFLAMGQLRAAETRRPLVIASNTGISAILSAQGAIIQRTHPARHRNPVEITPARPQILFLPANRTLPANSSK